MRALRWLGLGVLVVVVLIAGILAYFRVPGTAAGLAAKSVCSATFVAGRDASADLLAQDVTPTSAWLRLTTTDVDEERASVTGRFLWVFRREASLLPDRGCVLDAPADPSAEPRDLAQEQAAAPLLSTYNRPWPVGNDVLPESDWPQDVDAAGLKAVVDAAMADAGDPAGANARAIAVVQDGALLVDQQAPGFEAGTGLLGWSMSKTITAMLFSRIAWQRGLDLDSPVVDSFPADREPEWVDQWRHDERAQITLADLLYMRDGLAIDEDYGPRGDVVQMLYREDDMAGWAASHDLDAAPGSRWRYLSSTTNILAAVIRAQVASDEVYWQYPRNFLFATVGATSARMETDEDGTWVSSSYVWASAGDWARFGQLALDDGRWGYRQVLPAGWLKTATTPAMAEGEGRGYGAQLWLVGDPVAGECRSVSGVPADAVAMQGHWGQLVAIVPSRKAVIVRMGWTVADGEFDGCRFISDVLATLR